MTAGRSRPIAVGCRLTAGGRLLLGGPPPLQTVGRGPCRRWQPSVLDRSEEEMVGRWSEEMKKFWRHTNNTLGTEM